jgi:hypothetical protein
MEIGKIKKEKVIRKEEGAGRKSKTKYKREKINMKDPFSFILVDN